MTHKVLLDRPWNTLAYATGGYFLLVQPADRINVGDHVEVEILNYPHPQPLHGEVEDTWQFSVDDIQEAEWILLKQFYGMSDKFILDRLKEKQFYRYAVLGVRTIVYVY